MSRSKIVIVEDEPSLLGLLAAFLGEDYDVLTAKNGEEGISLFDANHVSLILLDVKMKGMDGVDVLRRIRGKSGTVPIIMMTGYSTHETAIKCADLGIQGYILKPPKLEDLKRRIDDCLGLKDTGQENVEDKELNDKLKNAGPIIKGALKVISDRYRDPALSRNLIAEAVGISEDYLSKQFHKGCGISIPEYISRVRMSEAAKQLVSANIRISEIAMSLGFSNLSYFSATFKKHFSMTPEQYRREKRIETRQV